MSAEERLKLLGIHDSAHYNYDSNIVDGVNVEKTTLQSQWMNNTQYKVTIEIDFSASAKTSDEDTDWDSLRWEAEAHICKSDAADCSAEGGVDDLLDGQSLVGWGGFSVRQYDNVGFQSAQKTYIIELDPNDLVTYNLIVKKYDTHARAGESIRVQDLRINWRIIGTQDYIEEE